MPLIKRLIEPVFVSRVEVTKQTKNELELVTNHTLANIIRQLSGLSKQADDLFSELGRDVVVCYRRTLLLQQRVETLGSKVTQLDATVEEVSLTDINQRKPYKSAIDNDQEVVSRTTIPASIVETYTKIDPPPHLSKLDVYRDDGKQCLRYYTDPGYFVELWYYDMQKDMEKQKNELRNKKKKRPRGSRVENKAVREVKTKKDQYQKMAMGQEFRVDYETPNIGEPGQHRPSSLEISAPQGMTHHPELAPPKVGNNQRDTRHMNGPVHTAHNQREPHHPSPVNNSSPYQSNQYTHYDTGRTPQGQVVYSPDGRKVTQKTPSTPNRPANAPPPPPAIQRHESPSGRETLPPPPPPPPVEMNQNSHYPSHVVTPPHHPQQQAHWASGTPIGSPARNNTPRNMSPRDSPLRQMTGISASPHHTPDSVDLPPPPPPPPLPPASHTPDTPISSDSMPPPPSPPPFEQLPPLAPSPPPPPPPPPPTILDKMDPIPNGHVMGIGDGGSISSNVSSMTASSGRSMEQANTVNPPDERCALLAEIRKGTWKLKTVEEKRKADGKRSADRFDVQAIMDKAFEMRRKALENSDSEEESDENDWDA